MITALSHAAPAFNGDFYVTIATVIPVLFLAITLQGDTYKDLLSFTESLARNAQTQQVKAGHKLYRALVREAMDLAGTFMQAAAALILIAGIGGEIASLWSLCYTRNTVPPAFLLAAAAALVAVIGLPLFWAFARVLIRPDIARYRAYQKLQRLPWRHGCTDPAGCCAGRHRRSCPKRCPKAARKSGRPHVCIPPDAQRLCPPHCTGHASMCPERLGGGLVFRQNKEGGHKTLPLPPRLAAILKAHRMAQLAERMRAANVWEDFDLVFAQQNGRPIDNRADWEEWRDILKAARIPHAGTHAMRHSAATIMLELGVPLAVVQEILGHSDIRITRGYSHVSSQLAEDAAGRMGEALFGPTVPATVPRGSAG